MKATFLLENLLEKISFLNHAISQRPPLPILAGFLIETEKGKLRISATDLEIGISTTVPASIEKEGRLVVPAKPFAEILANLSEEKITIEKNETNTELSSAKTKATLLVMDDKEFPKLFDEKGESVLTIKKETVEKDLNRVVFAASQDLGRPAFSGVLVKKDGESVSLVATDSHRLSLSKTTGVKTKATSPLLVSARVIRAILSEKSHGDIEVFASAKNNQVIFDLGETVLVGRTIEAEFPDFAKIVPDDFGSQAVFDKEEFLRALKVTSVFARDNANIVKISLGSGKIQVFAKSPTLGQNTVEVAAKTKGDENEIAFNGRYLLELLQNIGDGEIVFEMQGPLNPGVFKIAGDPNFTHLIMPIRVKDEELPS